MISPLSLAVTHMPNAEFCNGKQSTLEFIRAMTQHVEPQVSLTYNRV